MMDAIIEEVQGRRIRIGDHWLCDFASCNYLGFDLHPEIIQSVERELWRWGTHPSWSRLLGNPRPYIEIEEQLTELLGAPDTLVLPTITLIHASVIPILAGHGVAAKNEIVLGAATLAGLHKRIGDTVTLSYLSRRDFPTYIPPTRLKIVGVATFPAVGYISFVADHTSMGTGALLSGSVLPSAFQRAISSGDPNETGPDLAFVRLKPDVGAKEGLANLEQLARRASRELAADPNTATDNVTVLGVQRPAQIVNYRSIGSTPVVLAVGLAAGAMVALGLALATSVRRRRRDLALLKALGLAPRQLVAAVAWQATIAAAIGIVVGIPLGIVAGRQLWILFARTINAVPSPAVPVLLIVLVGLGALVFANLAAVLPGRAAARASTAPLLRTE